MTFDAGTCSWRSELSPTPPLALVVLPKNIQQQPEPAAGGGEEAEHRESGITEELKMRRHAHQQRGAHDQRGEHEAGRDAVGEFLKTFQDEMRFGRTHLYV